MTELVATLDDACEFIVDCLHATAPIQDEGYPLIRTPNVGKGRLQVDDAYRVSEDTYEKWTRRATPVADDLILAREAPAGNVAIVKNGQQVCLGQRTVHLRPDKSKIDPDFLCYYLLAPQQQGALLAGETGATAKHVNMKDIRRLPLKSLPQLGVQQKIGATLCAYDDLIENNRRRIQFLEQAARLLYKEWFVRLRFPGHEHAKIKDGIPEGWELEKIGGIAEVVRGKSYKGSELRKSGGKSFVTLKCLQRYGGFRVAGLKRFDGEHKEQHRVAAGDIVMAVTDMTREAMIVAQAALVPKVVADEAIFSMDLVKIVPKEGIQKYWLYSLLRHSGFSFSVREHATGTNVLHLKPKYIKAWETPMPPESLREHFSDIVEPMIKQQDQLELQAQALIKARDLLLPRLMAGEVAV